LSISGHAAEHGRNHFHTIVWAEADHIAALRMCLQPRLTLIAQLVWAN